MITLILMLLLLMLQLTLHSNAIGNANASGNSSASIDVNSYIVKQLFFGWFFLLWFVCLHRLQFWILILIDSWRNLKVSQKNLNQYTSNLPQTCELSGFHLKRVFKSKSEVRQFCKNISQTFLVIRSRFNCCIFLNRFASGKTCQ